MNTHIPTINNSPSITHYIMEIMMFPINSIVSYYRYSVAMSLFLLKVKLVLAGIFLVLGVTCTVISLWNDSKLRQESLEREFKREEEAERRRQREEDEIVKNSEKLLAKYKKDFEEREKENAKNAAFWDQRSKMLRERE